MLFLSMSHETKKLQSPAAFIRDQLDAHGMTQMDLAFVLGVNQQAVNQLALGKRGVSAEMAKALGEAFEVPAEEILSMQKALELEAELDRARAPDPAIGRKARLTKAYPIREMIKRGWLVDDQSPIESQVAHIQHAAKKTTYVGTPPAAQLVWLVRVKSMAERVIVPPYSEARLRQALPKLRALMDKPQSVGGVPRVLSECGVRFVLVENLPGGKIDGVCLWLDGDRPVIGMSLRLDRIDNFWLVLRPE